MRVALAIVAALLALTLARADEAVDQDCRPVQDCAPTQTCAAQVNVDNRNCLQCLLKNPFFGGCLQRGIDPACEAAKSAQNSTFQAQALARKEACEATKASAKLACEVAKNQAVAECLAKKSKERGAEDSYQKLVLLSDPQSPIPSKISETLISHGVYQSPFLDKLTVSKLENLDLVPAAFQDAQELTVGSRIFLKPGVDADGVPLKDWIKQIEMAKLFAEYGLPAMRDALTKDAAPILGLIDTKAGKVCGELGC